MTFCPGHGTRFATTPIRYNFSILDVTEVVIESKHKAGASGPMVKTRLVALFPIERRLAQIIAVTGSVRRWDRRGRLRRRWRWRWRRRLIAANLMRFGEF